MEFIGTTFTQNRAVGLQYILGAIYAVYLILLTDNTDSTQNITWL